MSTPQRRNGDVSAASGVANVDAVVSAGVDAGPTLPRKPPAPAGNTGRGLECEGCLAAEKIENRFGNSQRASRHRRQCYVISNMAMLMCLRRLKGKTQATVHGFRSSFLGLVRRQWRAT